MKAFKLIYVAVLLFIRVNRVSTLKGRCGFLEHVLSILACRAEAERSAAGHMRWNGSSFW